MAKYKKRPDGRYATSFIIGHNADGKTLRRTLYGRTIMELERLPILKACRIKVL